MDQQLLRDLRQEVAESLSTQRRDDVANGLPVMTSEDERQFARAVIARVLEGHAAREIAAGRTPPSVSEESELAEGIHAALYGVGLEHASDHRTGKLSLVLRAHRGQVVGRVFPTLGREGLGHLLAQVAQQLLVHGVTGPSDGRGPSSWSAR